ncbi:MAG: glycosyltransferase family 2 protein, partial [Bacteroidota bacterium]
MDPSLISILMPVRNATPFLAECLDSILNQEERHWELLAVNDHSTDHSADILQAYAARDPRIQALSTNGRGITPALRQAFGAARGTLITRMDADDRMLPGKLHHLKSILLEHGPGIIATGKVRYFSGATLGDGYQRYAEWLNGLCVENNHWRDRYRECVIPS